MVLVDSGYEGGAVVTSKRKLVRLLDTVKQIDAEFGVVQIR